MREKLLKNVHKINRNGECTSMDLAIIKECLIYILKELEEINPTATTNEYYEKVREENIRRYYEKVREENK